MSRNLILAFLCACTNLATAAVFILMWQMGAVQVVEDNIALRTAELVLALGVAIFALWCFFSYLRRPAGD